MACLLQKTAGNSVTRAFGQPLNLPEKHFTAQQLKRLYGDKYWQSYFKFAFVRNPWDRLVSWWSMINGYRPQLEAGAPPNNFQRFILQNASTFEEFLENCDREIIDPDGGKWIYRNQIDYLIDANGDVMVDFIGRFEDLQKDFAVVASKASGWVQPLSHENKAERRGYATYYSPQMAAKPRFPGCRLPKVDCARFRRARQGSEELEPALEAAQNRLSDACVLRLSAFGSSRSIMGRTSPVGLSSIVPRDAHAGRGGDRGRSRSIRRSISANSARGTATSASWKTT
jgi:hypothetical protein